MDALDDGEDDDDDTKPFCKAIGVKAAHGGKVDVARKARKAPAVESFILSIVKFLGVQ